MSLFLSSGAFESQSVVEIAAECADLAAGLELTSSFAPRPGLVEEVEGHRFRTPLLIHNYFPPPPQPFVLNLAATDPGIRRATLAHCEAALDLCARKGVPFYSVHAGFAMNLLPAHLGRPETQAALDDGCSIPPDDAERAFVAAVREVAAMATAKGLRLLLENNVLTPVQVQAGKSRTLLMTSPRDCARMLGEIDHPAVGLLLDTGHANVAATALGFEPDDFFVTCEAYIEALHLSDNDGLRDANGPFRADSWFAPHLKNRGHLSMVIEVYHLTRAQREGQLALLRSLTT